MPPRQPKVITHEDAAAIAAAGLPLFHQKYSRRLQSTKDGQAALARFAADPRCHGLDDHLINYGSHARSFALHDFVLWFLWCRDELGAEATEAAVDRFFIGGETTVLESQWALGLAVDAITPLGDGCELRPIEDMPESDAKERYLFASRRYRPDEGIRPASAFVCECKVPKFGRIHHDIPIPPEFNAVRRRLGVLPLLVNALDRVSCLPGMTTSYCAADVPFGPFGTGGGGFPHYDVLGMTVERFPPRFGPELFKLLLAYEKWPREEGLRLQLVLFRLCQAKRHSRAENKMLDLGVALEMALLSGRGDAPGVSKAFRERGAALMAKSPMHREKLKEVFRRIYAARSAVAHNGTLHGSPEIARDAFQNIPAWLRLAGRVIRKLLKDGPPDWANLGVNGC